MVVHPRFAGSPPAHRPIGFVLLPTTLPTRCVVAEPRPRSARAEVAAADACGPTCPACATDSNERGRDRWFAGERPRETTGSSRRVGAVGRVAQADHLR